MTPHTKRKMIHLWRRHIRPILVLVLVFTAFRSVVIDWNDVPSGSMKPTILEGDRILVNKLAYGLKFPFTTWHLAKWSEPQKGEIVVFYSPANGDRLVKRLVATPGDHIRVQDGLIFLNGQQLSYTDTVPDMKLPKDLQKQHRFFTEQLGDHPHIMTIDLIHPNLRNGGNGLPPQGMTLRRKGEDLKDGRGPAEYDEYFMMGDNRDNSGDSRQFGTVAREQIVGRANRIIFSLDYDDAYLPRKNRFFHALP